jgi:hypothetical protein
MSQINLDALNLQPLARKTHALADSIREFSALINPSNGRLPSYGLAVHFASLSSGVLEVERELIELRMRPGGKNPEGHPRRVHAAETILGSICELRGGREYFASPDGRMVEPENGFAVCARRLAAAADILEAARRPPPPASGAAVNGHKKKRRSKNVNACMLEAVQENTEVRGWTIRQWAAYLKCGKTTVFDQPTWKMLSGFRDQLQAERALDSRRR